MGDRATVCIGVVVPLTGRLAPLGEPLSFVLRHLAPHLKEIRNAGRTFRVRVAVSDSRSEVRAARQAVSDAGHATAKPQNAKATTPAPPRPRADAPGHAHRGK